MRVLITLAGGSSSIEGDVLLVDDMKSLLGMLESAGFIIVKNTSFGEVVVNTSAISYIRRKQ